jgi:hypothetical protein
MKITLIVFIILLTATTLFAADEVVKIPNASEPRLWEIFFPAVATLLAAFLGAWFAYRLRDKANIRKEHASNISAANQALFTVFQQVNSLKLIQWQMIDPVRNHPMKFIAMQPILHETYEELKFDFPSLVFLLNTKHKQIVMNLFIEQQRFREAINSIRYRSSLHINQIQPILERAGIQEGADYTIEVLARVLGQRLYRILQRTTDQVIFHVDRTVCSLYDVKEKMIKAFKELYPESDFLNFELLEAPPNKNSNPEKKTANKQKIENCVKNP